MSKAVYSIKPFEKKINNNDYILKEAWVKNNTTHHKPNYQPLVNTIIGKLREARSIICIMSGFELPKGLLQEIPKLTARGVRAYLLVQNFADKYTGFLDNKAILRVNPEVSGFVVLVDPKKELESKGGYLFSCGDLEDEQSGVNCYSTLNGAQLQEAFQYFVWNFWSSSEEYRKNFSIPGENIRAPFDVYPLLEPESFLYNGQDQSYLVKEMQSVILSAVSKLRVYLSGYEHCENLLSLIDEKAEQGLDICIYTNFKQSHSFFSRLRHTNKISFLIKPDFNTLFILADDQRGLLLSGCEDDPSLLGVSINPKDIYDILLRLEEVESEFWKFQRAVKLGQIESNEVILAGTTDTITIEETKVYDYGTIQTDTLRQFVEGNYKPEFKETFEIARTFIHRWELVPKTLDNKAKLDPIYEQWKTETKKLKDYLDNICEYARSVKREKKAILGSLLSKLFSKEDGLNIDQIIKDCEDILSRIEQGIFNWADLPSVQSTLEQYVMDLLKDQQEFQTKKDFYEKKFEWEKDKDNLVAEKEKLLESLDGLKRNHESIQREINELSPESMKQLDELNRQMLEQDEIILLIESEYPVLIKAQEIDLKVRALCKYLDEQIKRFNAVKKKQQKNYFEKNVKPYLIKEMDIIGKLPILESIIESNKIADSKEQMKYIVKELATNQQLRLVETEDNKEILEELTVAKQLVVTYQGQIEKIQLDNNAGKRDQQTNLKSIEKQISATEAELFTLEKKIIQYGEDFVYTSKKSNVKLPFALTLSLQLPQDILPKVGKLYRSGNARQLAILEQDDLDLGEEEAMRLKAELVFAYKP